MIRNFLLIALRNLSKRKGYSLMNIGGLAIGITCCLLIFEYVAYEKSFDNFHENADRVFRVQDEEYQNGRLVVACASAMPGIVPAMKKEFPEVEDGCRMVKVDFLLANDEQHVRFEESSAYYADAAILKIFHIPLVSGNPQTALTGPGKIIISTETALKYFGKENPVGKILTVHSGGRSRPLQVTAVFKEYPQNSHLRFNLLVSYPTYSQVNGTYGQPNDEVETSWSWTDFYTYILLRKGTDAGRLSSKLPDFIDRHFNNLPENKAQGDRYSLSLVPLKDIHLYSHYTQEAESNGDGQSVNFLFIIAFFILGIAWVNYINLATARSLERAKEVGLRKVLGAAKWELVRQFMTESFLLNILALFLAFILTLLLNPFFAKLTSRPLESPFNLPGNYLEYFFLLFVCGTILSGIYPALVLSRYKPVVVLKGMFKNAAGGQWLRKGLIVGQFAASIILIAGTMIVYRQVSYMQNQDLGVKINQTIGIRGAFSDLNDSSYKDVYHAFKNDLLSISGVKSITGSSGMIGEEILWSTNWKKLRGGNNQATSLFHLGVDDDFIDSYGLKIKAGEAFHSTSEAGRKKIILNESAVKALGFASDESAIGEYLKGGQGGMDSMLVTGVVNDFHIEGLQKVIQPLVLLSNRRARINYSVKIQGTNTSATVSSIKNTWDKYFPNDPFTYFFLDDYFKRQYSENERFGKIFGLFAMLAIGIACFGLLGLSAYNVLQRTKEIGVRKVLGASVNSLVFTLSKDFLVLVFISFLVAIPVTWIAMHSWIQGFAYRTGLPWWIFASAGFLAILIALFTVGWQSLKASLANPIKSLRTE